MVHAGHDTHSGKGAVHSDVEDAARPEGHKTSSEANAEGVIGLPPFVSMEI